MFEAYVFIYIRAALQYTSNKNFHTVFLPRDAL